MSDMNDFDAAGIDVAADAVAKDVPVVPVKAREPRESAEDAPRKEKKEKLTLHKNVPRQNIDDYLHKEASEPVKSPDYQEEPVIDAKESDDSDDDEHEDKPTKELDDYGNPIKPESKKEKMYSQQEVNNMIRERLARGNHGMQPTNAEVAQATQAVQQQVSQHQDADWQVELKSIIKDVVTDQQRQAQTQAQQQEQQQREESWRNQELQRQAEFEDKFNRTRSNYRDFETVLSDSAINDGILMAARGMSDPAAFLYNAAKKHPKDIERISRLTDITQIGLEIGRLDEKMRKAPPVTRAPRPLKQEPGDMGFKVRPVSNIDSLIENDARLKLSRQRIGR